MTDQPLTPARIRIAARPGGASIVIDGVEVGPSVVGYSLQHDVHTALPTVVLHTRHPDGIEWEGMARVAVGVEQPPGELIAEFLASIDPAALDRAALQRDDLDNERGAVARAILRQLADWALGKGA